MNRIDPFELGYSEVEVFQKTMLFTESRVARDSLPSGYHLYELRHEDENGWNPCQLKKGILVNFYGSLICNEQLQLPPDGILDMNPDDLIYHDGDICRTMQQYMYRFPANKKDVLQMTIYGDIDKSLFYSKDAQADKANGCIGHLRGDFGTDGTTFYYTWFPHLDERLNTEPFKKDLQRVIEWLRNDHGPLSDLQMMKTFCVYRGRDAKIKDALTSSYGFQIDSDRYQYMLRCSPQKGDYNFYLYCYDKEVRQQEKVIPKKQPKKTEPER